MFALNKKTWTIDLKFERKEAPQRLAETEISGASERNRAASKQLSKHMYQVYDVVLSWMICHH